MTRPNSVQYPLGRGRGSTAVMSRVMDLRNPELDTRAFEVMKISSRGTPLSLIAFPTSCSFCVWMLRSVFAFAKA